VVVHRRLILPSVVDFSFNLTNVGNEEYQGWAGTDPFEAYLYGNGSFIQPIHKPGVFILINRLLSLKPGESYIYSFSLAVVDSNHTRIRVYPGQYQLSGVYESGILGPVYIPQNIETPKVSVYLH
jgi:hypothetical protein